MIETKDISNELLQRKDITDFMYATISANLAPIYGDAWQDNKAMWYQNNIIKSNGTTTVVAFDSGLPCAYFQYSRCEDKTCLWGEMEIDAAYKGDGITFFALITHFLRDVNVADCNYVHAHINNRNKHSINVFMSLGFRAVEFTPSGAKYIGQRHDVAIWQKKHHDILNLNLP